MPVEKLLGAALDPRAALIRMWRKAGWGSFELRLKYDAVERPHYAYGLHHAARLAGVLGLPAVAAIEFGVAGGNGLLSMGRLAREVSRITGVKIEVYGFDTGQGLPKGEDYRDLPYLWPEGSYAMDVAALQARIGDNTSLILGDVRETAARFVATHHPAPIGFIAFDMDLYSSTRDAFEMLRSPSEAMLPRVLCYFDDLAGGTDFALHCDAVGELAAIAEYNATAGAERCLAQVNGLQGRRAMRSRWAAQMYAHHIFGHSQYNTYVFPGTSRQLELQS